MDAESSQYKRRSYCDVTVHRNPSLRFDTWTLAEGKVGTGMRLPEQILRIKEGYEYD